MGNFPINNSGVHFAFNMVITAGNAQQAIAHSDVRVLLICGSNGSVLNDKS